MTSTMSKAWVLKIPCSHDEGYVLLQASSSSDLALDLNLLATEGDAPYKGKSTSSLSHQRGALT